MSDWIHYQTIQCPYCAEHFEIEIDTSIGVDVENLYLESSDHDVYTQNYIEDCYVCCRPIKITTITKPNTNQITSYGKRLDD